MSLDVRKRILYICIIGCSVVRAFAGPSDTTSSSIIRAIQIVGNSETRDRVILREMSVHAGDTLSLPALERDRDRIYNLGLFNKVTIAHADTAAFTDVIVTVVERWYIFPYPIFSLRSRSLSTLTYGLGVTHQNFLGRNEKLSAGFSTGYDQSAFLTYQNPRLTDNDDIFLRASLQYRDSHALDNSETEFRQITRAGSLSLGKRFGLFQTVIGTAGYERWQVPDTTLGKTVSPDGTDRFFTLGVHYTYDARNVREYPTDGFYIDATATKDGFGSESTIGTLTFTADVRSYTMMTEDMSIAWRGFGSMVVGGPVPVYHHLFLSPRLGIRGYNRRDYEGEELVGGQAEVRVPVIAPRFITFNFLDIYQFNTMRFGVYAALFADVGKLWYRSDSFEDAPWLSAGGIGLHFLLPYSFVLRVECSYNALGQVRFAANGGVPF